MRYSLLIIGNSSSGLLEAPTYNIPAVNIGRRQDGRVSGLNVIHTDFVRQKLKKQLSRLFQMILNVCLKRMVLIHMETEIPQRIF